ncbi:MAG: hypothetical protein ACK472_06255, partial [Rhodoluna sp.]
MKRFITLIALSVVGLSGSLSAHAATLPSAVINFTTPSKAVYGDPDKQLTITQNAGVTTVISTTPAVCSVSIDLKVKVLAVGVCRLSASNPGTA